MLLLKKWIKEEEGFRDKPYIDTEGVGTFGYGFTYLTKEEAEDILNHRLADCALVVSNFMLEHNISLDEFRKEVLMDMVYQLGATSVSKFTKMWKHIEQMDYIGASHEMMKSKWFKQTPERCKLLADRMARGY